MKKLLLLISIISCAGCEKAVNPDLATKTPRLVIEASINLEKGTTGHLQTIKLSTTTGYYQSTIPVASGGVVFVTDDSNRVFNFIEQPGTGNYVCSNFIPEINGSYNLTVNYDGQTYKAQEKLLAVPNITSIEQQNDLGLNSDEFGVKINFNDIPSQENFYLLSFISPAKAFREYINIEDQYNPGTTISWLYSNKDLKVTDKLEVTLSGISKMYYNYMKILIQASGANAGPFQTPLTNPKGNIINQNTPENYALGYFNLSETQTLDYTIN